MVCRSMRSTDCKRHWDGGPLMKGSRAETKTKRETCRARSHFYLCMCARVIYLFPPLLLALLTLPSFLSIWSRVCVRACMCVCSRTHMHTHIDLHVWHRVTWSFIRVSSTELSHINRAPPLDVSYKRARARARTHARTHAHAHTHTQT